MKPSSVGVENDTEPSADRRAEKRREIHVAAIDQFTEHGIAGTSMAKIADAAGMSRPALYQYFRDKDDIFASAFVALFEEHVDEALSALNRPGATADQLDGMLQRFEGDLWQRMSASPHSEEIVNAKNAEVSAAVERVMARLERGLATYLKQSDADTAMQAGWVEVLRLSPKGFKSDQPTITAYRRRLTTLARGVAADIDGS